ncbi:MAG: hypothetical protein WA902_00255 [Thermosynechococcaceae cyanobacterium]
MQNTTKTALTVGLLAVLGTGSVGLLANAKNAPTSDIRIARAVKA